MVRYTCRHEMTPMIEAALAANGYRLETSLSRRTPEACLTMMTRGDGGVLLSHTSNSDLVEIDVWGTAQSATTMLLEALPLPLERRSPAALMEHALGGK